VFQSSFWYSPVSLITFKKLTFCVIYILGAGIGQSVDNPRILGSVPSRDNKFSPLHKVQSDSGVHPASYRMSTGGGLSGGKAAGI
jgi:hypothetical protein